MLERADIDVLLFCRGQPAIYRYNKDVVSYLRVSSLLARERASVFGARCVTDITHGTEGAGK